jgi:hypothetical protein
MPAKRKPSAPLPAAPIAAQTLADIRAWWNTAEEGQEPNIEPHAAYLIDQLEMLLQERDALHAAAKPDLLQRLNALPVGSDLSRPRITTWIIHTYVRNATGQLRQRSFIDQDLVAALTAAETAIANQLPEGGNR